MRGRRRDKEEGCGEIGGSGGGWMMRQWVGGRVGGGGAVGGEG